ncbi:MULTISPECIES: hypothetical protein [unclassified Methanosarcina]|nr:MULTISPECIES: hypothetical protein [unclassified Methanosarcina]
MILNTVCPYAEGPLLLLIYLSFIAFIPVLNSLNVYWSEMSPELPEKPLTGWQITLLIIGIVFFSIILLGTFLLS